MPSAADIKWFHAENSSYTSSGGGRMGTQEILRNVLDGIHTSPSYADMVSGITRYRKIFVHNQNSSDLPCREARRFPIMPTPAADDSQLMAYAGWRDTIADIDADDLLLVGAGTLQTALSGGETSVALTMENVLAMFEPGGYLRLCDYFLTAQTIASGVDVADSVELIAGTWQKVAIQDSYADPYGRYVGDNIVMTIESGMNDAFLQVKDTLVTDEDIGNGDGADTSPALTTLSDVTNGLMTAEGYRPVITATCGGSERTVNVAADGTCSGYCSAGTLNMTTGVWTVDITWTTAPDNSTDIEATYYRKPYAYSGNVATVELDEQVPYAFATADTYGAGCLKKDYIRAETESWVETVAGDGTYDETSYPLDLENVGPVDDDWTITIGAAGAIACSGTLTGALSAGNISGDYAPNNPLTSTPYFTLDKDGFADTWASGDTITFTTRPSQWAIWLRNDIGAGIAAQDENHYQDGLRFG